MILYLYKFHILFLFFYLGFVHSWKANAPERFKEKRITLYRLKVSTALGAAAMGAKSFGFTIPLNFNEHVEAFLTV